MKTKNPSVVLAFDPMDPIQLPKDSFRQFSRKFSMSSHSLSVLKALALPKSQDIAFWERKIAKMLSKYGVQSSKVILSLGGSRNEVVDLFLRSPQVVASDCIALFSHGRSGLSRWVLGSFAEFLLMNSKVPLIFFPKIWKSKSSDRTILFSTDFSEDSLRQLDYFLTRFPVEKVFLYHSIHFPVPYASLEAPPQFSQDFFSDQEEQAKKQFQKWKKTFSKFSVELSFVVQSSKIGFLSGDEILDTAVSLKVDMVLLSAKADALQRFLFGSAAFDLFRKNRLPVFVFGPKFTHPLRRKK